MNGLCLGERRRIALTREGLQEHRLVKLTDLDVDDDDEVDVDVVIDASVFKSTGYLQAI